MKLIPTSVKLSLLLLTLLIFVTGYFRGGVTSPRKAEAHLKPHFFNARSRRHMDKGRAVELTIFIPSLVWRSTTTRMQAQP